MNTRSLVRRAASGVALAVAISAAGCGTDTAGTTGGGGSGSDNQPFVADPPAVYVAKVKNILVGLPPSDDEIAQVTADPGALGGLIDGWMKLPQYDQKMLVFFELAFQQTQITAADFVDIIPPNGLGIGRGIPLLVQNVRESFARTVLALGAEGRPLTDAFTTRRLMMTPALMELYAFLDTRQINDAGRVNDAFATANTGLKIVMETAQGPIPIAQSIDPASPNFMHWFSPDIATLTYGDTTCNGIDPISFTVSALSLHQLLYGEIPNHPGPSGNCGNRTGSVMSEQVAPTDFTTWKMVAIRAPKTGEARTVFYDLPALRAGSELVLSTPRIGFFSTPAFFANWPTNSSNQMRVTANQALIVATGTAIDGQDATTPSTTPGLDAEHAAPGTACFGCHQLLDPTRSILSATYSWFYYPQADQALMKQPGQFAFQGVVAPMHTIDDFAQQLASHPLVAQAWGQKLCYYVNSAPCNPIDPEFLRVLDAFTGSGMAWNTLVRELLASPITTNTSKTATFTTNGAVIAVSRRDHLCAALNNRLGFVDICQLDATAPGRGGALSPIAQIVSGMPSDGYGRGSTAPVLPNEPNLFYRAGLENVCAQVAAMVIDAKPTTAQPGVKQWSSAQPADAIAELVSLVMAMPSSDPRAAQATSILTSHHAAALDAGATPTDALRSTFLAACLSPSFIGIGM
ncbi:MAG TPA: hypothetical protein VFK02_35595 [Kofleriaceae bacterium]|nr:hypothetical protein [Kofleriaceae bacterium]